MDYLSLKNAIFYPNQIVILKKRGKVLIDIIDIERGPHQHPNHNFKKLLIFICMVRWNFSWSFRNLP